MTARRSKLFLPGHRAHALAFGLTALCATGCSSSSSGSPTPPGGDNIDSSTPGDGGVGDDATLQTDGGNAGGDDASSPHNDGGSTEGSTSDPSPAGEAGAA